MPVIIGIALCVLFWLDLNRKPKKRSAAKKLGEAIGDYLEEKD